MCRCARAEERIIEEPHLWRYGRPRGSVVFGLPFKRRAAAKDRSNSWDSSKVSVRGNIWLTGGFQCPQTASTRCFGLMGCWVCNEPFAFWSARESIQSGSQVPGDTREWLAASKCRRDISFLLEIRIAVAHPSERPPCRLRPASGQEPHRCLNQKAEILDVAILCRPGAGLGRKIVQSKPRQAFFSQGDAADSVFYLQKGRAKLTVVLKSGKRGHNHACSAGDFVGEESLATLGGLRMATATTVSACTALKNRAEREMIRAMHE